MLSTLLLGRPKNIPPGSARSLWKEEQLLLKHVLPLMRHTLNVLTPLVWHDTHRAKFSVAKAAKKPALSLVQGIHPPLTPAGEGNSPDLPGSVIKNTPGGNEGTYTGPRENFVTPIELSHNG
jgi:hypothetical protein